MLEFDYKGTHFLVNNKILLDKNSSKCKTHITNQAFNAHFAQSVHSAH